MNTQQFIPTAEKVEVLDYPYGFRLRTTLYDTMEFNPSKGYRHVTQTINPKTNRINNPKKSTYYDFLLRYKNEEGHIHNHEETRQKIKDLDGIIEITEAEATKGQTKYKPLKFNKMKNFLLHTVAILLFLTAITLLSSATVFFGLMIFNINY